MTLKYRTLADDRRGRLKAMLAAGRKIRAVEAHNPLSAIIGSNASIARPDGTTKQFDAIWLSGFTCAAARGLPDAELGRFEKRLETIEEIAAATSKPLIADGDTGGDPLGCQYLCARLESLGVAMVIIEDKIFPKRTSLAAGVRHDLEAPAAFVDKIGKAKDVLLTDEMLIFARIESLIAGAGLDDALTRARAYLRSSADGIVIHSKDRSGEEIFRFLDGYNALCGELGIAKPLLCIPTAYNFVNDAELFARGASVVMHANHLLRAAYQAMQEVCASILEHDRSLEADGLCVALPELFELIGVGA
ncbi:MAG: isocitrate lyase/phosphoenolpyruvate mutase family protein [Kiloniellaceae bacterium]